MRCSDASVFSNGKEGKTSPQICISPPVVQSLFYTELTGILMDSNMEVDKQTLKYVRFDTLCIQYSKF